MITKEKLHLSNINVVIFCCISILQPVLIVFLFFFRSRTLLLVRRTCRRRKPFCDGPRRQPTSTPESTSKTSPSHGGTDSPSMPSSTETGDKISYPTWVPSTESLFLPTPCEGVSLSAGRIVVSANDHRNWWLGSDRLSGQICLIICHCCSLSQ